MAKEIERSGIPVAYVTTLTSLAEENRANRIVAGVRIPHPLGNPLLTSENELQLRTAVTRRALEVLTETVDSPKVFRVDHPGAH
jgi:glycine/betaine/sarcosine/D-proline reductase family selenoprotein B